jgi:hypothetical protein
MQVHNSRDCSPQKRTSAGGRHGCHELALSKRSESKAFKSAEKWQRVTKQLDVPSASLSSFINNINIDLYLSHSTVTRHHILQHSKRGSTHFSESYTYKAADWRC